MNNTITNKATQKVDPSWIKRVKIGNRPELSYIPIDKTIKFLNDSYGDDWNVVITNTEWMIISGSGPMVTVSVQLEIGEGEGDKRTFTVRSGVGSDIHKGTKAPDVDKLVKTAYANAVKKATNMLGFGLELWDEANVSSDDSNQQNNGYVPPPPVQEPPPQQTVQQAAPQQAAPQQVVPPQEQVANPAVPKGLSPTSKEKINNLMKRTGYKHAELEEFLRAFNPNSGGNPASLTVGNEDANVDSFIAYVEENSK